MGRASCSIKRSVWFHLFVVYTIVCVFSLIGCAWTRKHFEPAEGGNLKNDLHKTCNCFLRSLCICASLCVDYALFARVYVRACNTYLPSLSQSYNSTLIVLKEKNGKQNRTNYPLV